MTKTQNHTRMCLFGVTKITMEWVESSDEQISNPNVTVKSQILRFQIPIPMTQIQIPNLKF